MKSGFFFLAACLALAAAGPSQAGLSIGSGGSISLGQGGIDLGGGNLQVDGLLDIAGGSLAEAGDVVINGTLEGGSGEISVRGDWINDGSFNAGNGLVELIDDVGGTAQVVGNSTFHDLLLTSSAGGSFVFQSASVQRVTHALTILGLDGQPVQLASSAPPQVAELVLEPGGSQNIAFVGVSDVYATGQHLAPEQTNQGGNGNDFGWFGSGAAAAYPVPALSIGGLVLLILAFFGVALARRGGAT